MIMTFRSLMPQWLASIIVLPLLLALCSCSSGSNANDNEEVQNALLWKVESDNGNTSYLFGTLHIMKSNFLDQWGKVREAYENSDKVIVETVIDSSKLMQFSQKMAMKGRTLRDYVDSSEYQQIRDYASGKVPYRMATLERFKPMQIMLLMAMAEYRSLNTPLKDRGGMEIDQYFARNGMKKGKEVIQLEELLEQADLLYNTKSNQEQADMLVNYVEEADAMEKTAKELVKAYENQKIQKLMAIYEREGALLKSQAYLIDDRNKDWMKTATKEFTDGGAFMAVGALHLPGANGLIQLLREEGFEVKPMNVK